MTTIALVTTFPPSKGSLTEYAAHLANALAGNPEVKRLVIIADTLEGDQAKAEPANLPSNVQVHRVWTFNDPLAAVRIVRAVRRSGAEQAVFNLQTASFGDREIPAALGLLAPALTRLFGVKSGVIAHNLIDAIEVEKTVIGNNRWRTALVRAAGKIITHALLKANYVTVTLDSFADILQQRYRAKNVWLVPHGSFPAPPFEVKPVAERDFVITTMGKFGTYKRLERLIAAFFRVRRKYPDKKLKLRIGGPDHPATPGYVQTVKNSVSEMDGVDIVDYVAEEDVAGFFASGRLAVFDYESTTGSSGVLHQAACFAAPPAYPLMGDFVDVTEREGLSGFHYKACDEDALVRTIETALFDEQRAQKIVDDNLTVSNGLPMSLVASFHVEIGRALDSKLKKLRFLRSPEDKTPGTVLQ